MIVEHWWHLVSVPVLYFTVSLLWARRSVVNPSRRSSCGNPTGGLPGRERLPNCRLEVMQELGQSDWSPEDIIVTGCLPTTPLNLKENTYHRIGKMVHSKESPFSGKKK